MASIQRAQTGNRVYGGVGQAPNRGQVSARGAQGYVKRELNRNQGGVRQPVGKDGKSDSRSGVASRALSSSLSNGGRPQAGNLHPGKNKNNAQNPMANKNQDRAVNQAAQPQAPVVPQIKVNDKGMLELPYSQNLSATALSALEDSNQGLLDLQAEEQNFASEIAAQRRTTDQQYGQLKEQSLGANASNGTAFSSMYAKAVSDNATAYSNTLGDLSRQESDFTQQASNKRASIQSSLAQQLAAAAQEEADSLNEDAGDLGYGTYSGETHAHEDNSTKPGKKTPPKKNPPKKDPPKNDPPKAQFSQNPPKKDPPKKGGKK